MSSPTLTPTKDSNSPSPTRFDIKHLFQQLVEVLFRQRRIMIGWTLLVLAISAATSVKLTTYTWQARAVLLYSSVPMPEQQKDLYNPPDLKTLTAFVATPYNLEPLCEEFNLGIPAKALEKNLEVVNPPGTKMIQLNLRWGEGQLSRELLSRVIQRFMDQVAEIRRRKIESHIADYSKSRDEAKGRWLKASEELRQFYRHEGLMEFKMDQTRRGEELSSLQTALVTARRNRANVETQLKKLDDHMNELKDSAEKEAAKSREFEAAEETVADNRRRQDRLRELIADEQKIDETRSLLSARRSEADRLRPLVARGLKTRGDYDRLEAEIGVLVARIHESDKIRDWKKELERIDKVVVPKGKSKSLGSPIIQQTLFRKLELQLQLTAIDHEIGMVDGDVKKKVQEIDRLSKLQQRAESLARDVEAAGAQRQRVDGQLAALRQLKELGPTEFVVVTPPSTGPHPLSSNRKLLFLGTLIAGLAFGSLALLGIDVWRAAVSPDGAAARLRLPVLARVRASELNLLPADRAGQLKQFFATGEKSGGSMDLARLPEVRSLALKLRQHADHAGTLVLFSPAGPAPELPALLQAVATCLSRRDERVLVLATRPQSEEQQVLGLHDYLNSACDNIEELIQVASGYDVLASGNPDASPDLLATHRMGELVAQLRSKYSILLIQGPSLEEAVDLTILAGIADTLVVTTGKGPGSMPVAKATLDSLTRLGVPLLGQVVLARDCDP